MNSPVIAENGGIIAVPKGQLKGFTSDVNYKNFKDIIIGLDKANKSKFEHAKAFFRKLATQGHSISVEGVRAVKASYFRNALDCAEQYYYDAKINGLDYDRHTEESSIELFSQSTMNAGDSFLQNPMQAPFIPNWNRVTSAIPNIGELMLEAVDADNK